MIRLMLAAISIVLLGCERHSPAGLAEGYIESSDGVSLYYRVLGTAPDTIIVVHGGPGLDQGYLAPDLEPLADSFTLIFYDQRGGGRSTVVTDSALLGFESHVADLEAVRARLGMERVLLLGHSWGAMVAAGYAHVHPEKVSLLIAVSPGTLRRHPYEDDFFERATAWMDSTTKAELLQLQEALRSGEGDARAACSRHFELWFRGGFADPRDTAAHRRMRGDPCLAPETAIRNMMLANSLGIPHDWDWRDDFRDSDFPVLIIVGESDVDPPQAYEEWRDAFRNARLVTLPDAGHFPYVEQPAPFFDAVREFFRTNVREHDIGSPSPMERP